MKICSFTNKNFYNVTPRLGLITEDNIVIDLNLSLACEYQRVGLYNYIERANYILPSSLHKVLTLSEDPIEQIEKGYSSYLFLKKIGINKMKDGTPICFDIKEINLKAPLDQITSYRDFFTHEKHVKSGFDRRKEPIPPAWYEMPVYYKGATSCFIGPDEKVKWPNYTDHLDYELEIATIISKDGINIKKENASDYIFGFTILNDISARDIQKKEMSIRLGPSKGKDFCSVIGPVIVTYDEFDFKEPNLLMTAKVNGTEWSRGYSGDAKYNVCEMIEFASMGDWIRAGDLLGSGTVGTGCGIELNKKIKENDVIELTIEKIGTLKNTINSKEKI